MTVDPLDTVSDTATEDPLLAHVTLAGFYPPPMGGESLHVKQLAELLRECGVEVDVVNLDRSARPSREYRSAGSRLGRMRMLLGAAGSSSVFHLHAIGHNRLSWGVIAAVALSVWVRRRAALLTIHSGVFPSYVATFGPIRSWLAGRVLRAFRRILCVNGDIAATVRALGIDPQKALVVSPFLGIRKVPCLTTADEEIATRYHPLLVAVGGGDRDPGQGLPTIVQACRGLLRRFPGGGRRVPGRPREPCSGAADGRGGRAGPCGVPGGGISRALPGAPRRERRPRPFYIRRWGFHRGSRRLGSRRTRRRERHGLPARGSPDVQEGRRGGPRGAADRDSLGGAFPPLGMVLGGVSRRYDVARVPGCGTRARSESASRRMARDATCGLAAGSLGGEVDTMRWRRIRRLVCRLLKHDIHGGYCYDCGRYLRLKAERYRVAR